MPMKFAVTSASSVRGDSATSRSTNPAEISAPATMQALTIDPLLRNVCGIEIRKAISSLLEKDQPKGATEETNKRRVDHRERPERVRKLLRCDQQVSQKRQSNRDSHAYQPRWEIRSQDVERRAPRATGNCQHKQACSKACPQSTTGV